MINSKTLREKIDHPEDYSTLKTIMDHLRHDRTTKWFKEAINKIQYFEISTMRHLEKVFCFYETTFTTISKMKVIKHDRDLEILFLRIYIDTYGNDKFARYIRCIENINYFFQYEKRNRKGGRNFHDIYCSFKSILTKNRDKAIDLLYELSFFSTKEGVFIENE